MTFHIMTLFPEMVENALATSIIGRAQKAGLIEVVAYNIRDFTNEPHGQVDDYPYGGGAGMLMQVQPIYDCYKHVLGQLEKNSKFQTIYTSASGERFTQSTAKELSKLEDLIILCGHYEGIDERARILLEAREISIGDYVLTGGELPAMVIADAVSRMVSGVLTNENSGQKESFENNLLEYPQYTRPREFMGLTVPEILLSGDHGKVDEWRKEQAVLRTKERRPDMLSDSLEGE